MPDRNTRVMEISRSYIEILQQLNSSNMPEWLQLDLTFQQMRVLHILRLNGNLKMRELSQHLGVTMPTITGIVNRLIERKEGPPLISRVVSPEDRREIWAQLTETGQEALNTINLVNLNLLKSSLSQLNEADLESINGPLSRLAEAVKEQLQAARPSTGLPPVIVANVDPSSMDPSSVVLSLDEKAVAAN